MPGMPVTYAASPGASASLPAVTDANGMIQATLRLPASTGLAALSVYAGGQVVTFSALAQAAAIPNFPVVTALNPKGTVVAALSGLIRFYQNAGSVNSPNGQATPDSVNQYLLANGGYSLSESGTAIGNPWVATLFAGLAGGVSVDAATVAHLSDLIAEGTPALALLSVQEDGATVGTSGVDATGVNADGSIAIMDPSAFGRASLSDYLGGFSALGHSVQATLSGVLRIVPAGTTPLGFVVASQLSAGAAVASGSGPCGNSVDLADGQTTGVRFIACDGLSAPYQISFAKQNGATVVILREAASLQLLRIPAWRLGRIG